MHSFLHPDVRQSTRSTTSSAGTGRRQAKKTKAHKLPKSQVSVLVLNGGTVAGEAANTTYLLTKHGYTTKTLPAGDAANAPKVQRDTIVYYDPVQAGGKQAAQQLQPLFGSHPQVARMTLAIRTSRSGPATR